jgi:hypothetical protein
MTGFAETVVSGSIFSQGATAKSSHLLSARLKRFDS